MDSPEPATNGATEEPKPSCYVDCATPLDIMFEQFEYLASHHSMPLWGGAPRGENCPDCQRLEQIQALLMAPFR